MLSLEDMQNQSNGRNPETSNRIRSLPGSKWPEGLFNIPQPPMNLRIRGYNNFLEMRTEHYKFLTVVGSRKHTDYGYDVCKELIKGLRNQKICLVSGLAYGIDSIAHRTALEHNLKTIAFPGSGLEDSVIYPRSHHELAQEILQSGGSLISEFDDNQKTMPWMFPQRNRLMVGIADAVLIIEAGIKSGSGITANMAVDYNRTLMAVPGSIFNHNSQITNKLIKNGASVVTSSNDILENLNLDTTQNYKYTSYELNTIEKTILEFIQNGANDREQILEKMKIPICEFNRAISRLEIEGLL